MPYNFAADSFHTKKRCSTLYSSEVRFFTQIGPFCVFHTPFGVLIELFSLGVTAEALRAIIG